MIIMMIIYGDYLHRRNSTAIIFTTISIITISIIPVITVTIGSIIVMVSSRQS